MANDAVFLMQNILMLWFWQMMPESHPYSIDEDYHPMFGRVMNPKQLGTGLRLGRMKNIFLKKKGHSYTLSSSNVENHPVPDDFPHVPWLIFSICWLWLSIYRLIITKKVFTTIYKFQPGTFPNKVELVFNTRPASSCSVERRPYCTALAGAGIPRIYDFPLLEPILF